MKKALLLLAGAALLFAGCAKEQVAGHEGDGKTVEVCFTATLSGGVVTKATSDNDGSGIYADQCKLQVLWGGKVFYEKTVSVSNLEAKFENVVLIKDQTYDFLFWADNKDGAYYDADDLTKVKLVGTYVGCNDKRDAFSNAIVGKTVSETFSQNVVLTRPFAQLNVITTDIPALRTRLTDDALFASSVPEKVSLSVTVPTVFNIKTAVSSEPKEMTYTAPVYADLFNTTEGARNTLSMDYLLAPAETGNVIDVSFSAKNETSGMADIDYTFSNVPLRRNYRTNILGALITVAGTVNVEIKPAWLGETDVDPFAEED